MQPAAPDADRRPGIVLTHGARATEEALLDRLDRLLGTPDARARLAAPVRVVVPSTSLRLHLGATLARRHGAVAGVVVQTLFSTAREVLERCGETPPWHRLPGDLPYEVLVRRLAREEGELSRRLDFLVEGYGAVSATVRDLLDAGLEPVLADAAEEALEEALTKARDRTGPPVTAEEVARGRALVRVAARVDREMERHGVVRRATLLSHATRLLATRPAEALPARAVLIHGFTDATGLATDFLEALMRHRDARLFLDAPPDPATHRGNGAPDETAVGRYEDGFGERFRERLAGVAGIETAQRDPRPAPSIERFAAPGGEAEAREVAVRVRRLLDAGARPEGIGVVAREIDPHATALRRHFTILGVPWSGVGAHGSLTAAGRRTRALLELLQRRGELPTERWLDATLSLPKAPQGHGETGPFVDLRLAFAAGGRGRLRDAAALDLDRLLGSRDALPLPVRTGLAYRDAAEVEAEDEGDDAEESDRRRRHRRSGARAHRRRVPRHRLAAAVAAAAAVLEQLRGWPGDGRRPAPPAEHLEHLDGLLTRHLGWSPEDEAGTPVFAVLESLRRDLPGGLGLTYDELRLVLGRALEDSGRTPLGGRGGGVQVLSVVEARGRTFEHLFVVGAQRGAFPRTVRYDPLLPDDLRRELASVLPDVPRKRTGFDEERYLFAQLLSASPRVILSWQLHDDDGQPVAPSPLVERLAADEPPALAPPVYPTRPRTDAATVARPASEEAILAALRGAPRPAFGDLLEVALPSPGLAAARLAVLEEFDPDPRRRRTLGPYLGFLGAVSPARGDHRPTDPLRDDPRQEDPWLTHVENLAACPWQLFLRRLLRVEPTPDPLQALPGADPLLLGNVVHRVLEALVAAAGGRVHAPLATALAGEPTPVPWPDGSRLRRLLRRTAEEVLADQGIDLPGLARALALRARPYVDAAGRLDWPDGPDGEKSALPVLGAELRGELSLRDAAGRPRTLRFRADRVDAPSDRPPRPPRLTDYKTGKPVSEAKRDSTVARHHLKQLRSGTRLQATAYHRAAGELGVPDAVGRYLFLKPGLERAAFTVGDDPDWDRQANATLAAAGATVLAAWDTGAFFPRVVDPQGETEPQRCSWCEVAEACVRGDSGARLRLAEWNLEHAGSARSEAELAHHDVWRLATGEEIGGEEIGGEDGEGEEGEPDRALRDTGRRPAPQGSGGDRGPAPEGSGGSRKGGAS